MFKQPISRSAGLLFLGLGIAAAGFIYVMYQGAGRPRTSEALSEALTEYSFTELRPPSTLLAPGTWVEVVGKNPLKLGIICRPAEALGDTASNSAAWSTS